MAQSPPPNHIEATIGDVSGGSQVAVGSYIVQIGRVEGGVVNILNAPPSPPRLRPQPVSLRPKAFTGMLDRETETMNAIQALQSKESVECSGEPGAGKTSLLRHLAHQPQVSSFSAGVIYFQVNQQSNADLLKSLFDAFYEYDSPIKPTETETRHYLQSLNALILLDNLEITPEQIESLMNMAPGCTFAAATTKRSLFGETREVSLKGLPTGDAVSLFEKELGRVLSAEEQQGAQYLCESVGCIPQRVLRAAHQAREENSSLVNIVPQVRSAALDQTLAAGEVKPRSEDEKKVLYALATFYGAPVAAEHLATVAGVSGITEMLDDFERRGLVQSHEERYMLASDVKNALSEDLKPWLARALAAFADWTEKHRGRPELIAESAQPILLILQAAAAANRWPEVKRLGHAVEEALALSGKWDMWATALQSILKAARAQQDRAEEAWALHQLGTRALCLGAHSEAMASLSSALGLRESLNDQNGAAVTRHNLNILLGPPPPTEPDKSGRGAGPTPIPFLLKLGALGLLGLVLIAALVVWRRWSAKPPVNPVKVVSFSVNPTTVPANGQAQLCYEVENAGSVRIEPNVGERKSPTSECQTVSPEQTTTYTLTATGLDGKTASQEVTLNVEITAPPLAQIRRFDVVRENGPGGASDLQFRLCYEVRDANHAQLDNGGGPVVLNQPHCQQVNPERPTLYTLSATGSDGRPVTRQAYVDATKPAPPPPQVLTFSASPLSIIAGDKAELCFQLKDASSVQIDSGVPNLKAGTDRQCVNVAPLKTTTYTLTALNLEGKASTKQTTIRVTRPGPQIASFTAQPNSLQDKGSVQLCYDVLNADALQIDNGIGAVRPANKGCINSTVGETTTFTLTASGADGRVAKSQARVEVAAALIEVEFTAEPQTITLPNGASLCYRVSHASSISIDHGVGRRRAPTEGERVCVPVQPKETTTYTLTAFGSLNRKVTSQVTVTVTVNAKHARIIEFNASERSIKAGGSVRLCYAIADAEHASLDPIRREVPVEKDCIDDAPKRSTTYILSAVGADRQTESRRVRVEVDELKHARIIAFSSSDTSIKAGTTVSLCYAITDAVQASLAPISNEVPVGKNCIDVSPRRSTKYVLTAVGEDKQPESQGVSVEVVADLKHARIISFRASETGIKAGTTVSLCYAITDAVQASLAPISNEVPVGKNCIDVSPRRSTKYVLTAVGEDKQPVSQGVSVEVVADLKHARIIAFSASDTSIKAGTTVSLCYTITDAIHASLAPISRQVPVGKNCIDVSPKRSTRYVLTAVGEDQQPESRTVSVEVQEPTPNVPRASSGSGRPTRIAAPAAERTLVTLR